MDADQFKKLYLPFHPKLFRIAYALVENKDDAEDILQEAYGKLWVKREELKGILQPEAFSVTLVKNLCIDFLRSKKSSPSKESTTALSILVDESTPDKRLEQQDEAALLEQLLRKLPENQQQVIRLRGIRDCSFEEIEQITGLTAINIRVLLSRARKTLRKESEKINIYGR